ncbi:protein 5NUC-like [Ceratina calcarata]|uniref:5'-nucleotidase n=1 Tax=Ceratina calcarata TaxID=156304 RepID=A0AAJ7N9N5_9HYME|nr:protein 5NUC-like [Ceratina calcarata]XP_017884501.1 protein 5NUC-like [Ceratina calcarata]XP_017884502.1 protein 5NUC-like [Ceratina calcarata]XP_017884503.1 protein 5NUC-like [Ceratina calcarata]XP_017884504.1 protein 5NUC-like [Ceratina calcarata]XP_017884505.1 protein 5NUC-like [Ceratina calcarata]XP_017884508.1 protein 5NUC-like [Ceratina calcarata]XP_017884509.1 protein 5NUC-like [Ceratina calcarata]XP_026671517.1 protein 5NUC-like [Ceratina calcarata]
MIAASFLICILAFVTSGLGNPVLETDGGFTLRIVHTNDMHSRFEQTSRLSSVCSDKEAAEGKCYGGFARIATLVRQARNSSVPCLFLNAGDTYQGSTWFSVYKWEIVARLLNILKPDAISLGNHEFDNGVSGLVPFIQNASFPIVTANLDLRQQPDLANTPLLNSTILTVNGTNQRIGVIGYLTPETKIISKTDNVTFLDEVESIRREVKRLKGQGVNILIAVGHSGFDIDKKIAREVEDIDLVIGGHTNTFLYTGKQPDTEVPEGLYPTEIKQKNGRKVYVVQAYAYTKYLGNFTVNFDRNGEVTSISGNPVLVNSSIEQAEDVLDVLEQMRGRINNVTYQIVGKTRVLLEGDSKVCRREECNLGNLIADSMVEYNAGEFGGTNGWTDAAIAFHNGGSIRTSITTVNDYKITMGDVLAVLPFQNSIVKVSMTGEQMLSVLEWSVYNLRINDTSNLFGAFVQVSGLQVVYDLTRPNNSRVLSVEVLCASCNIPMYSKLEKNKSYTVLLTDFMQTGGDGYSMLKDLKARDIGVTTSDALVKYLERSMDSPVHPAVEWRISYLNEKTISGSSRIYGSRLMTVLPAISWLLTR